METKVRWRYFKDGLRDIFMRHREAITAAFGGRVAAANNTSAFRKVEMKCNGRDGNIVMPP
ncbi:hypothetical protein [Paenibacillus contaminans]|uniref:Uncharacterized protein n=1 Tax=Paenibacillus contaminans TaxID=450362 RepID=A0A329MLF5_9BACL|nr:hypothetical protein [Paenibacillus contaminans]RAV20470.1 hypothetical protein DQG23_16045 [Paenibacillus contaminans]